MNFQKLSREQKEALYIEKMTKLQRHWGNPIDDDWGYIKEFTDEQLNAGITDTIGQLRFEMPLAWVKRFFVLIGIIFIALGIVGLLLFGIRQITG